MHNYSIKVTISPAIKADAELKNISSALDQTLELVASGTRFNDCLNTLNQLETRIEDYGRNHFAHGFKPSDALFVQCKHLAAKAVNGHSVQDLANALAIADSSDQREKVLHWLKDASKSYPFFESTIDKLAADAVCLLTVVAK